MGMKSSSIRINISSIFAGLLAFTCSANSYSGMIHEAVMRGNLDEVQNLLSQDPKLINSKTDAGETLLQLATRFNRQEVVDHLIQQGAHAQKSEIPSSF